MNDLDLLQPTNIIKSKRKSISLIVKNNGEFFVRAPLKSKDEEITKFILQKADWIIKKRTEQIMNRVQPLSFDKQENITLLGKQFLLTYDNVTKVKQYNDKILLPNINAKEKLIQFLKKQAKTYLTRRAQEIATENKLNFSKITISSAKSCWGSCSFNNNLHFTYKLMLCPPEVVDYVIVHELCHTKVKNHSSIFWTLVQSFNPNYKTYEKWLKKNRAVIELI